jgi:hypothetical protein
MPGRFPSFCVFLLWPGLLLAQTPAADTAQLINLSVRSNAGTGSDTLIVGFSLAGSGSKPLLVRGVGPTLAAFGVSGTMADPTLRLEVLNGALVAQNDNWDPVIAPIATGLGAFALNAGSRDAAISQLIAPGTYTAQLGGGSGVALVEVYDSVSPGGSRLVNLSARTRSGSGGDVLIAGFGIGGTGTKTLLIRGIGPGLAAFGVQGALADPQLTVFAGATLIVANDNWGGTAALTAASAQVGAFALPSGSRDAALLVTLPPGSYTAQVAGVNNTTGIALVEVYEMRGDAPAPPTPLLELFATESGFPSRLFLVSPATGAASPIASLNFFPGLEFRRNGVLYGAGGSLAIISPQNGATSTVGTLPELIVSIAFAPDDTLYGVSNGGSTLYRIDPATGRSLASVPLTGTTHASGNPFSGEINAIDFAPDGTLYGVGFSLYRINPATGVATKVSASGAQISGQLYGSLDLGPDGVLRAATAVLSDGASSDLYAIDTNTGVGVVVGNTGAKIGSLAARAAGGGAAANVVPRAAAPAEPGADIAGGDAIAEILRAQAARVHAEEEERARMRR